MCRHARAGGGGSYACRNMGVWGGLLTITLVAVMSYYSLLVLVRARNACTAEALIRRGGGHARHVTYVDLARFACVRRAPS